MLIVRGGEVVDATGRRRADVLIDGAQIVAVGPALEPPLGTEVLDAGGCLVSPGLVDLHVHLRQPGGEVAETVETGCRGAALGGFTAVVAMPNTVPAMDRVSVVAEVAELGRRAGLCHVMPSAAITIGRAGERLVDFTALYGAGVRMFTDDGNEVADAALMRQAFEATRALAGAVLGQHAECAALVAGGHLHEGAVSAALGLAGRPSEAEEVTVARDLALARLTGGRLHVLHASCRRTAELVARAKADGVAVTMEVTPQHLTLTDECCAGGDPTFKVNPPLRTGDDVAAMRAALGAGTVDAIATDHAPHGPDMKARPFADAPPGMLGLETAVGVIFTELVEPGVIGVEAALAALSWRPAAIVGLVDHGRPIAAGEPANLCVIDPNRPWRVNGLEMASRSRNTPFEGWELRAKVRHTILGGSPVVCNEVAQR